MAYLNDIFSRQPGIGDLNMYTSSTESTNSIDNSSRLYDILPDNSLYNTIRNKQQADKKPSWGDDYYTKINKMRGINTPSTNYVNPSSGMNLVHPIYEDNTPFSGDSTNTAYWQDTNRNNVFNPQQEDTWLQDNSSGFNW